MEAYSSKGGDKGPAPTADMTTATMRANITLLLEILTVI
jgi:hypothetical protein